MARAKGAPCTAQRLRELIDYDPKSGQMTWRQRRSGRIPAGHKAGSLHHSGYVYVELNGRAYSRARLAWLYAKGVWPTHDIDHKNGIRDDDRLANLREATRAENSRNKRSWSKHGVKGVSFHARKPVRPWNARIYVDGKNKSLGYFATKAEAGAAYSKAANELYGRFSEGKRSGEGSRYVSATDQRLGNLLADMVLADIAAEASGSLADAAR